MMRRAPSRLTFLVLVGAALATIGGLSSLAFGIECFTQNPTARCGVLAVAVPLVSLPLGGGLAVMGMGLAGRLVRESADDETDVNDKLSHDDTGRSQTA